MKTFKEFLIERKADEGEENIKKKFGRYFTNFHFYRGNTKYDSGWKGDCKVCGAKDVFLYPHSRECDGIKGKIKNV